MKKSFKRIITKKETKLFFISVDIDDSRQFIDGRRIQEGERVPKHAPIGYCDSKLMNAIFARELASRHKVWYDNTQGRGGGRPELLA